MMSDKEHLSDAELLRYSRHILLPQLDIQGQLALCNARVLVLGLGGLGSPVALYLAAAGVGELVLADFDQVDESNLQRQIVHQHSAVGENKARSAAASIKQMNPNTRIEVRQSKLAGDELEALVRDVDAVVDCSDNFATRCQVNSACWHLATPLISGAAIRFEGQLAVFDGRDPASPCYQCLFPKLPDEQLTCAQSGVLSPLVGVIGSMQAVETIKLISCCGPAATGRLQLYDALSSTWRSFSFKKDPGCPNCAS